MSYDFEENLRGDVEEVMNAKEGASWLPALAVGIVISVVQLYVAKNSDRGDTLVKLETQMGTLIKQVDELAKQPYIKRDEFEREISRVERRIDALERPHR